MAKNNEIIVKEVAVKTIKHGNVDYICMTDIARMKNAIDPNGVIANWMRNRNTIEFLGIWETLYNPNFNPLEFEGIRAEAGLNAFTMSPTRWVELTNAIGIISQAGRPRQPLSTSCMSPADGSLPLFLQHSSCAFY